MGVRVEIFECEMTAVTGLIECFHDGRPVGCAIEQRTKRFKGMIGSLLGEFLEMDIFDALAENGNPVLGKLKEHDVAGIKMDAHVRAVEAVDEGNHLGWSHE